MATKEKTKAAAAPAKKAKAPVATDCLMAYSVRAKENRKLLKAVIDRTVKGARTTYIAKGEDSEGNKMAKILSEPQATNAIKQKWATKGWK